MIEKDQEIRKLASERDQWKDKALRYERSEQEKKILTEDVINSKEVKAWVSDLMRTLSSIKASRGSKGLVLKKALASAPTVVFLPSEIATEVGLTERAVYDYLKEFAGMKLLLQISKGNRTAFRNYLRDYVTEGVRRIKPEAPDTAIDQITEQLEDYIQQ